jgi:hypothetical protein
MKMEKPHAENDEMIMICNMLYHYRPVRLLSSGLLASAI